MRGLGSCASYPFLRSSEMCADYVYFSLSHSLFVQSDVALNQVRTSCVDINSVQQTVWSVLPSPRGDQLQVAVIKQ